MSKTMWRATWPHWQASRVMDDLDAGIRLALPEDRAYRPEQGRELTGGRRMNRRDFRRWRRLLDRLDRATRRR